MTDKQETLARQMKRLKLRFKDVLYRPLIVLRDLETNGGYKIPKGDVILATGTHRGRLSTRKMSGIGRHDVALVDPESIDRRKNAADHERRGADWFKGRKVRVLNGRDGFPAGSVFIVARCTGTGIYGDGRVREVVPEGPVAPYFRLKEIELIDEPEKNQ